MDEIQIHTRGHQRSTRDGSLNEFFLAFSSMDTFSEDLVFLNEWLIAAVSRLYLLLFLLLLFFLSLFFLSLFFFFLFRNSLL